MFSKFQGVFLLLLSLSCTSDALAANWVEVATDNYENIFYLDKSSLKIGDEDTSIDSVIASLPYSNFSPAPSKSTVSFWVKTLVKHKYKTPISELSFYGSKIWYGMSYWTIDCVQDTHSVTNLTYYNQKGYPYSEPFSSNFYNQKIVPDTVAAGIRDFACKAIYKDY